MQLYYRSKSCSLAARIAVYECGLECEFVDATELLATEAFRAANPLAQIPLLVTACGKPLTELTAILVYLSDISSTSFVPAESLARARCLEWLSLFSAEFHPNFYLGFKPARFSEDHRVQDALAAHGRAKHDQLLRQFASRLGEGPYVLGAAFSAADAVLVLACLWSVGMGVDLVEYPRLHAWSAQVLRHPSVRRSFAEEGIPLPAA